MRKLLMLLFTLVSLHASDEMGALLFHGNCVTCHFELEEKSAPAMIEVRKRYISTFPKKQDFVKYLSEWVANPSRETSIMQDAIKKHELMPHIAYEKDVLEDIAAYIYDTDFNKLHSGHRQP
ncbi:c-type cytochrome [Sulfurimonas indica]|uniref:c-type cytochrome n=1 Tax=Sulfurimonas indica TaxID=2508707 RepID=UPI001CB70557|nr:c-type cytochrome [Sulfurimonas indica]